MTVPDKVVNLYDTSVYDDIMTFLNDIGNYSINTKLAYQKDIEDFFRIVRGKDLKHLTVEDLDVKYSEVKNYRQYLIDSGKYSNATINRKIDALRSLYRELKKDRQELNPEVFDLKRLKEVNNSYGILSPEEAEQMAELALTTEKRYKKEKYLLIHTAIRTTLRLNALLSLRWKDIYQDPNDSDRYIVQAIDKGGELVKRPITKEFYNKLLEIKKEDSNDDDKIFDISPKYVNQMIRRLAQKMGIPKERNITFHSLRKVGINFVYNVTGDIRAAAKQAGHKNFNTTDKYVEKDGDYMYMAGILMDQDICLDKLNTLTKEQIIDLIKQCSIKTKYEIANKLKHFN